jgi:hypothetical protein
MAELAMEFEAKLFDVAEALEAQGHAARVEGGGATVPRLWINLPDGKVAVAGIEEAPGDAREWWASVYASDEAAVSANPLSGLYVTMPATGTAAEDATALYERLTTGEDGTR